MENIRDELGDLSPLRTFEDFTSSNRFKTPDWNNNERLANRVLSNLIYYQTNYFLLMALIFGSFFLSNPRAILGSVTLIGILGYLALQATSTNRKLIVSIGVVVIGLTFFREMLWFLLSLSIPLAAVILHSATRMRNVKNKAENLKEVLGVKKKNPMSYILKQIGFTHEFNFT
uniref:PRA1 family protein n=1 Tax=Caligus clemensi TaxID=344056 RepID=C1C3B0_CALCM|nr:PRA1 family protein 3 [Caligus clemensi]